MDKIFHILMYSALMMTITLDDMGMLLLDTPINGRIGYGIYNVGGNVK